MESIKEIELGRIKPGPNPRQPRILAGEMTRDLENSMKTIEEQRIPIVVTVADDGNFEIIDGHRRFHVASKFGWPKINAIVVQANSEQEVLKEMGIINMHMQELTLLEKGMIVNAYFESEMKAEGLNPKSSKDRRAARAKMLNYLSKTVFKFTPSTLSSWLTTYESFEREDLLDVNSYEVAMVLQTARRLKVEPTMVIKEAKAAQLTGKGYWALPKVARETGNLKEAVQRAKALQEESISSYISYPMNVHDKVRFLARTLKVDTQAMIVDLITIGALTALDKVFSQANSSKSAMYERWDSLVQKSRETSREFNLPTSGPTVAEDPELFKELQIEYLLTKKEGVSAGS